MSDDGMREVHVTAFDVGAGARHTGLGVTVGPGVPLVALEIEGRPSQDACDESLWLRLTVDTARALGAELIQEGDHAEQLARRQAGPLTPNDTDRLDT